MKVEFTGLKSFKLIAENPSDKVILSNLIDSGVTLVVDSEDFQLDSDKELLTEIQIIEEKDLK